MAESLRELNDALDALSYELLQACERYVASRSPKDFQAWLTVNARYVALHREWWALAMPDVAYDSVFAPLAEARVRELEGAVNNECSLRVQATDAAFALESELAQLRERVAKATTWLVTVKSDQPASIIADRARLALEALRGK